MRKGWEDRCTAEDAQGASPLALARFCRQSDRTVAPGPPPRPPHPRQALACLTAETQGWLALPHLQRRYWHFGRAPLGEAVGLEMESRTDGQGARDSLSPTKELWVFTALGTVCKLRPPYSLHSLRSQSHPPQPPAPERFSFHVAAENRALYKCSSDLSKKKSEMLEQGLGRWGANAYPGAVPRALGRALCLFCCLHPGTSHYIQ